MYAFLLLFVFLLIENPVVNVEDFLLSFNLTNLTSSLLLLLVLGVESLRVGSLSVVVEESSNLRELSVFRKGLARDEILMTCEGVG